MPVSGQSVFDARSAEQILRQACDIGGIEPNGLEVIRVGDHAVFRLHDGKVVARVGRDDRLDSVRREVGIARWLEGESFPAARLVAVADQPIVSSGHPVTFWEGVGDGTAYATTTEMGHLLRWLHGLKSPDLDLPKLAPFEKANRRIERAEISHRSREYLVALSSNLAEEYAKLEFALPVGVIHGDYNVGNVLHDQDGKPRVIDLDGFMRGPREWDLMQTAMYYDSFGWHSESEYRGFAEAYGFDVRSWSGYRTLRTVRELLMVTWLSQNAGVDARAAAEVEKRIESMRTDGSRRDWAPF